MTDEQDDEEWDPRDLWPVLYQCQDLDCWRCRMPSAEVRRTWLIAPRWNDPTFLVIRCPEHITEWALRCTMWGRLKVMQDWAARMREYGKTLPQGNASDPFLIKFMGAQRRGMWDMEDIPDYAEILDFDIKWAHLNRAHWQYEHKPGVNARMRRTRERLGSNVENQPRDEKGMFVARPTQRRRRKKTN